MLAALALLFVTYAPVPVYIGPVVKDGFADVDQNRLDTIRDLKTVLAKNRRFRIVPKAADARIELLVADRSVAAGETTTVATPGTTTITPGTSMPMVGGGRWVTPSTITTTPSTSVPVTTTTPLVTVLLRVGEYEKALVATAPTWTGCAKQIAKDATAFVDANRERLEQPN